MYVGACGSGSESGSKAGEVAEALKLRDGSSVVLHNRFVGAVLRK